MSWQRLLNGAFSGLEPCVRQTPAQLAQAGVSLDMAPAEQGFGGYGSAGLAISRARPRRAAQPVFS